MNATVEGIVIAVLIFALILACISIFYEAQIIANQRAVINILEERR